MDISTSDSDPELEAQLILLAATNHNIEALRTLLRKGSANVRDPDTGYTPLHSAIAACEHSLTSSPSGGNRDLESNATTNGNNRHEQSESKDDTGAATAAASNGLIQDGESADGGPDDARQTEIAAAEGTLRLLLQNGAIWNDLDKNNNETPGCIAYRLGLSRLYDMMVDAGVRAEVLLNRLDGYEILQDEDNEDVEEQRQEENVVDLPRIEAESAILVATPHQLPDPPQDEPADRASREVSSETYLASNITLTSDRLLDQDTNGVMMAWETEIMHRTADLLTPATGLRILNIGHGMGIIDVFFHQRIPSAHHIIEAHPAVISHMKESGWMDKKGVTVHEGRWQDEVPKLMEDGMLFDAIYFDTFAEEYKELHAFFETSVIGLLDDSGIWGFFNGLGADRQICYDVYNKVLEIDLLEAGYDVEWETIHVPDLEQSGQWNGINRPYWKLQNYRLPVCTFIR